jgi:hypothetical protein
MWPEHEIARFHQEAARRRAAQDRMARRAKKRRAEERATAPADALAQRSYALTTALRRFWARSRRFDVRKARP